MIAALRSEYRKFFSTRMWWVMLAIGFGYVGLVAALIALMIHIGTSQSGVGFSAGDMLDVTKFIYSLGPSLGYLFPLLIGAMSVTGEFRHQTITPTFLAEPRRWLIMIAKLIGCLPLGVLYGVVTTAACVLLGGGTLALFGFDTGLGASSTWETLGRCVLSLTIWTLVGIGLGVLLKNQVAAIVVVLAFTQLVEPMLRVVPLMAGRSFGFISYLPGAAGEAIAGGGTIYSMMSTDNNPLHLSKLLSLPMGITVLVAYGVLFSVIGYFTTLRRDIT